MTPNSMPLIAAMQKNLVFKVPLLSKNGEEYAVMNLLVKITTLKLYALEKDLAK